MQDSRFISSKILRSRKSRMLFFRTTGSPRTMTDGSCSSQCIRSFGDVNDATISSRNYARLQNYRGNRLLKL